MEELARLLEILFVLLNSLEFFLIEFALVKEIEQEQHPCLTEEGSQLILLLCVFSQSSQENGAYMSGEVVEDCVGEVFTIDLEWRLEFEARLEVHIAH